MSNELQKPQEPSYTHLPQELHEMIESWVGDPQWDLSFVPYAINDATEAETQLIIKYNKELSALEAAYSEYWADPYFEEQRRLKQIKNMCEKQVGATEYNPGMTLLEHYAGLAMQAIMQQEYMIYSDMGVIATDAVRHAKALIAELQKEQM